MFFNNVMMPFERHLNWLSFGHRAVSSLKKGIRVGSRNNVSRRVGNRLGSFLQAGSMSPLHSSIECSFAEQETKWHGQPLASLLLEDELQSITRRTAEGQFSSKFSFITSSCMNCCLRSSTCSLTDVVDVDTRADWSAG